MAEDLWIWVSKGGPVTLGPSYRPTERRTEVLDSLHTLQVALEQLSCQHHGNLQCNTSMLTGINAGVDLHSGNLG